MVTTAQLQDEGVLALLSAVAVVEQVGTVVAEAVELQEAVAGTLVMETLHTIHTNPKIRTSPKIRTIHLLPPLTQHQLLSMGILATATELSPLHETRISRQLRLGLPNMKVREA